MRDLADDAVADIAALAIAVHDIRVLLRWMPERLVWTPGRRMWGVALAAGCERIVIAVDGCLHLASELWPCHYRPGLSYPLERVVMGLAPSIGLKRLDGATLFSCHPPQSHSGACCVIAATSELPWYAAELVVTPLPAPARVLWRLDEASRESKPGLPGQPWPYPAALGRSYSSPGEFLLQVGEPATGLALAEEARRDHLLGYWRLHARQLGERLRFTGMPLPAWLDDEAMLAALVDAWLRARRIPRELIQPCQAPATARGVQGLDGAGG